jgi:hypothetical protein
MPLIYCPVPHEFAVFVAGKQAKQTLEGRNRFYRSATGLTRPAGDTH